MVASSQVRDVYPLGPVQRFRAARMGDGERRHSRLVAYTSGCVRERSTDCRKIDVRGDDVRWPPKAAQWQSEKTNKMVFRRQPDMIVNNRNGLPGAYATPEQRITAETNGRAWESC